MADVVLFHHAQGLTAGCRAFAEELRAAGYVVHTPDLYDGHTFETLTDGMAYAEQVGFGSIIERGEAAVAFARPRPRLRRVLARRAAGAETGPDPPRGARRGVHARLHTAGGVRALAGGARGADSRDGGRRAGRRRCRARAGRDGRRRRAVPVPGRRHLFTDSSLPAYDAEATALVLERVRGFLGPTS